MEERCDCQTKGFILKVDARLQTLSKNTVDSDEFYLVEQQSRVDSNTCASLTQDTEHYVEGYVQTGTKSVCVFNMLP